MEEKIYIQQLLDYIGSSPTSFHVVDTAACLLHDRGFTELVEEKNWPDLPAGKYFVRRNDAGMIAFTWSGTAKANGLQMVGAHTDSPCLKLKPNPVQENNQYLQLGVEVYGGALLHPWFDRELSVAGRVCWYDGKHLNTGLVDFKRPVAIIPNLAIHLDREANSKKEINKQDHLVPVIGLSCEGNEGFLHSLQAQLCTEHPEITSPEITDFELYLYDASKPARVGLHNEFIIGARLDNQLSCFAALQGLVHDTTKANSFVVLSDHEEVGSVSTSGAQGTFVSDVLQRLLPESEHRVRVLRNSLLISADNAHAVHPNYAAKHDPEHLPIINKGPVIKWNANQRYATTAKTAGQFKLHCLRAEVPVQEFVMRSDMACGSTIGPLASAQIGVDTVDVGIASLAMHSIRETAGCMDCWYLYKVLRTFFSASHE